MQRLTAWSRLKSISTSVLLCGLAAALTSSLLTREAAAQTIDLENSDCLSKLHDSANKPEKLYQKRIELFYYREATTIANLINSLPLKYKGCASTLPQRNLAASKGVGAGGGNVVILSGDAGFVDEAYRLIAALDLPLAGIELQLLGIQISSEHPDKLAAVMNDVRDQISLTQQLVRDTNSSFQAFTKSRLLQPDRYIQPAFLEISTILGYPADLAGSRNLSLLDVSLVGYISNDPVEYYQSLYQHFVTESSADPRYQPYLQAMRHKNKPVFERFFRARGLKPVCKTTNQREQKCDLWTWEEKDKNLLKNLSIARQRAALEFVFEYGDFINNPLDFYPDRLQYTSDVFNGVLQETTSVFQRDIEEFLIRPTVGNIQKRVAKERRVSFAQVGRTTISTLSGVPTSIKSEAQSSVRFNNQDQSSITELLERAKNIQGTVQDFVPTVPVPGEGGDGVEIAQVGPFPVSQALGLLLAATEDQSKPAVLKTGTNLTFTPGVLRDLSSAELNIDLTVTSPALTSTAGQEAETIETFSRIGTQELQTSVYTQASDFFDLSTFTSQATLNGGRGYFPVIGQFWKAIFGNTPVLGQLFSYQRRSQNVLHESLLLTHSSIRPTPLGIGFIYKNHGFTVPSGGDGAAINPYQGADFCRTKIALNTYFEYLLKSSPIRTGNRKNDRSPLFGSNSSARNLNDYIDGLSNADREKLLYAGDSARCKLSQDQ